jgi:hypothetical protein
VRVGDRLPYDIYLFWGVEFVVLGCRARAIPATRPGLLGGVTLAGICPPCVLCHAKT